jgi:hypothetical protein
MTIHARVTTYKGKIICELVTQKSIKNEILTSIDHGMKLGQVVFNTSKHLGISKEALSILKLLKPGKQALGTLSWFSHNGTNHFGWLGEPYSIFETSGLEISKEYQILAHQEIINDVPPAARKAIDDMERKSKRRNH